MSRLAAALLGGAIVAAAWWWRKHPSACPYSQRLWVQAPRPLITRERLRRVLGPAPGERILEIGPGTGYYTLDMASWIGAEGKVDALDLQPEMVEHLRRRAGAKGVENVRGTVGDARLLPFDDGAFDAVMLTTVLGEIPDQDAALAEIARVLRPGGRLVVGELFGDPHWVPPRALERRSRDAGLRLERRDGPPIGYFARLVHAGAG